MDYLLNILTIVTPLLVNLSLYKLLSYYYFTVERESFEGCLILNQSISNKGFR